MALVWPGLDTLRTPTGGDPGGGTLVGDRTGGSPSADEDAAPSILLSTLVSDER